MKQVRTNAVRLLETAGVAVSEKFYDVSDGKIDAVSVAQKIGEPVEQVFKTLVTRSNRNECFVFVVPAAEELDLKKAADDVKKEGEGALDSVNKGVEGVSTGVGEAVQGAVDTVNKGITGFASGISDTLNNK